MIRSFRRGMLITGMVGGGLALAWGLALSQQPTVAPPRVVPVAVETPQESLLQIRENGRLLNCRVLATWLENGAMARQLENVDTGEILTIVEDGPSTMVDGRVRAQSSRIFHHGLSTTPPPGCPVPPMIVNGATTITPRLSVRNVPVTSRPDNAAGTPVTSRPDNAPITPVTSQTDRGSTAPVVTEMTHAAPRPLVVSEGPPMVIDVTPGPGPKSPPRWLSDVPLVNGEPCLMQNPNAGMLTATRVITMPASRPVCAPATRLMCVPIDRCGSVCPVDRPGPWTLRAGLAPPVGVPDHAGQWGQGSTREIPYPILRGPIAPQGTASVPSNPQPQYLGSPVAPRDNPLAMRDPPSPLGVPVAPPEIPQYANASPQEAAAVEETDTPAGNPGLLKRILGLGRPVASRKAVARVDTNPSGPTRQPRRPSFSAESPPNSVATPQLRAQAVRPSPSTPAYETQPKPATQPPLYASRLPRSGVVQRPAKNMNAQANTPADPTMAGTSPSYFPDYGSPALANDGAAPTHGYSGPSPLAQNPGSWQDPYSSATPPPAPYRGTGATGQSPATANMAAQAQRMPNSSAQAAQQNKRSASFFPWWGSRKPDAGTTMAQHGTKSGAMGQNPRAQGPAVNQPGFNTAQNSAMPGTVATPGTSPFLPDPTSNAQGQPGSTPSVLAQSSPVAPPYSMPPSPFTADQPATPFDQSSQDAKPVLPFPPNPFPNTQGATASANPTPFPNMQGTTASANPVPGNPSSSLLPGLPTPSAMSYLPGQPTNPFQTAQNQGPSPYAMSGTTGSQPSNPYLTMGGDKSPSNLLSQNQQGVSNAMASSTAPRTFSERMRDIFRGKDVKAPSAVQHAKSELTPFSTAVTQDAKAVAAAGPISKPATPPTTASANEAWRREWGTPEKAPRNLQPGQTTVEQAKNPGFTAPPSSDRANALLDPDRLGLGEKGPGVKQTSFQQKAEPKKDEKKENTAKVTRKDAVNESARATPPARSLPQGAPAPSAPAQAVAPQTRNPMTPPGVQSVLAANNGIVTPVSYIPVPVVTIPNSLRPPTPPPPAMPGAPQPTQYLSYNAFSPPPAPPGQGNPAMNGANPYSGYRYGSNPNMAAYGYGPPMNQRPVAMMNYPTMYRGPQAPNPVGYQPPAPQPPVAYAHMYPAYPAAMPPLTQAGMAYMPPLQPRPYGYANASASGDYRQQLAVLREAASPAQREIALNMLTACDWRSNPLILEAVVNAARTDPAPSVRAACCGAMARMNANVVPALGTLQALKNDPDQRVRVEADQALLHLTSAAQATTPQAIQPVQAQ